jgi:P27 family predicted phage terminase small subunit
MIGSMRGRRPKPTHLKLIAGNPGGRKLRANEPKPTIEPPPAPRWLSTGARAEWDRLVPTLLQLKLLSRLDLAMLSAYCHEYARYVEAQEQVAKASALAFTHNGFPIVNPWVTIGNGALNQVTKLAAEFGLSPSSRSRMSVPPPDSTDASKFEF